MKTCNQACPYNTLRGCVVDEHGGICILSNMLVAGCKPMTNADRIRAMSDEELCEFMLSAPAIPCNAKISAMMERNNCDDCQACTMEWLQQPAEEGQLEAD